MIDRPVRVRFDLHRELINAAEKAVDRSDHTVPNGTDPFLRRFLVRQWPDQATIVQSLRDGEKGATNLIDPFVAKAVTILAGAPDQLAK